MENLFNYFKIRLGTIISKISQIQSKTTQVQRKDIQCKITFKNIRLGANLVKLYFAAN